MYFKGYVGDAGVGRGARNKKREVLKVSTIQNGKRNRNVTDGGEEWGCWFLQAFGGNTWQEKQAGE